jgi:hypothetical protein
MPSARNSRRDRHRPEESNRDAGGGGGVFHREGFHRNEAFLGENDEIKDELGGFQRSSHGGFHQRRTEGAGGGFLRESIGGLGGGKVFSPPLSHIHRHRSESPRLRRAMSPPVVGSGLARGPSHLYGHPLFRASHGDLSGGRDGGHLHGHGHLFSSQRDLTSSRDLPPRFRKVLRVKKVLKNCFEGKAWFP